MSVKVIAGVDEAGRGPLAGPVVAAAVILTKNHSIEGLIDSKKLTAKKREKLYKEITNICDYGIGIVSHRTIDKINVLQATFKAMNVAEDISFIDTPVDIRDKYQYYTQANMAKLIGIGYAHKFHTLEQGVADYVGNYLLKSNYY